MTDSPDFKTIRSWDGSQHRSFEELCYQLRDPTPPGAELIKTGDPDGGLEWYTRFSNGIQWGWQAKYTFDVGTLLGLMEKSLKTVVSKRPQCRRMTFCIPFDLPDAPAGGERKSARQKFEDRRRRWRERIEGADRVRVELWSAGELLERLARDPAQRGKTWFFWNREVFSPEWCKQRLNITVEAAGERYSPELHVELPVAFALEGLAGSEVFWARFLSRRGAVIKASRRIEVARYAGIGVTSELRLLDQRMVEWHREVVETIEPPNRLPRQSMLKFTQACQSASTAAYPEDPSRREKRATKRQAELNERRKRLQHDLIVLGLALERFEEFLLTGAAEAAERGALLLTGEAGQGKTHLLCDIGSRAIDASRPVAVLLGGPFSGRKPWSDIAEQLGLGHIGSDALLEGMRAAAEAANKPFLLLLDALNEAAEPIAWQEELTPLLAEIGQDPWVAVGFSVRSTFLPVVLPPDGVGDRVAEVEHPGFRGRELEATERFFDAFGLEQPRIPLLTPEFTNPLFLKLYCEGLKGLGLSAPPGGEAHTSDVFERYLQWKSKRIVGRLRLDPAERPVERATEAFSQELAASNRERMPRDRAATVINQFAPGLHEWPNTLLGQLLNEGVLAADVAWDRATDRYVDVIHFSYQRFADHRVVAALLDPYGSAEELSDALAPREPLRERIRAAPVGWIEALAVQVPERFGVELLDAAHWRLDHRERRIWDRALVQSIVSRRPGAISNRTRELLSRAQQRTPRLSDEVLEALLAIAPNPEHLLNAKRLHRALMGWPLPVRDVVWSIPTYFAFGNEGALDRLIRWAARGPYPDCPDDVLELAAIPLIWTFTSPNRRMRDYATKALTRLLAERLKVVEVLIDGFRGVDDPYVMERLAVMAHGAILVGGHAAPESALALARRLKDVVLHLDQVPNILGRDAVRGAFEWCLREGLVDEADYASVAPPYGSATPEKPRTKKQLEKAYHRYKRHPRTGKYMGSEYGSIFSSVFDLGDFGHYVIESKASRFSQVPLATPYPKRGEAKQSRRSSVRATYPLGLAQRWVFERVLSLGWAPDRFASFDRTYVGSAGRSSHKPERFGKKYQWIALRELIARIADNFHMTEGYGGELQNYEGPWQFFGRDIDPTLPPAPRVRDDDDDMLLGPTFSADDEDEWWSPPGPRYSRDDPLPGEDWASDDSDIPAFEPLVRKTDLDGTRWVGLQAYYHWDEEMHEDEEFHSRRRRDMWSHIYTWLVRPTDQDALVSYLERNALMGRWMPEGKENTDDAYLAEMPWAAAAREYPDGWEEPWSHGSNERIEVTVYPTWGQYFWEGNVWDCSISDGVRAQLPAPLLFNAGTLRWKSGTRQWYAPDGRLIAQYRETRRDRHSCLLVREDWLKRVLKENGWSMVIGWLGEKQLHESGWFGGLVGPWSEINGIASLANSKWTFGDRQITRRTQAGH